MTDKLKNYIGGQWVAAETNAYLPVTNPATGETIAEVPLCGTADLDKAVAAAAKAQVAWAETPLKDRVQVLFRMKQIVERDQDRLAELVVMENGKTREEALGSIIRGVECIEYATSLPQTACDQVLMVGTGVECRTQRYPLGVVAGITPFNFPFMVPLWMVPLALGTGNAFILKPSEQTPLGGMETAKILHEAGLPDGIFSVVHGGREMVESICDHPGIAAVGFVGSTKVARAVHARANAAGKRVRALGGAKNHLIVVPDANPEMTATNVVASVTGCCGQRCMAASVLLAVGDVDHIVDDIIARFAKMRAGVDFGPVISPAALERISGYCERAEAGGAKLVVDGRELVSGDAPAGGHWIGPCVIDHATPEHEASCEEIFGPTLTIIRCRTLDEALTIENGNAYGNAAAVYTSSGLVAQEFAHRAAAGMIGVNIGVPVPREPFAFGGWHDSSFGEGDITGPGAIDFWTRMKKVTTKWSAQKQTNWMS